MNELKICKNNDGFGVCRSRGGYCLQGLCKDYEPVNYVGVVKCKDCEYYHLMEEGFYDCRDVWGMDMPKPDDFCSYGKRREENNVQ